MVWGNGAPVRALALGWTPRARMSASPAVDCISGSSPNLLNPNSLRHSLQEVIRVRQVRRAGPWGDRVRGFVRRVTTVQKSQGDHLEVMRVFRETRPPTRQKRLQNKNLPY